MPDCTPDDLEEWKCKANFHYETAELYRQELDRQLWRTWFLMMVFLFVGCVLGWIFRGFLL